MGLDSTIQVVQEQLDKATHFSEVFGILNVSDTSGSLEDLKRRYKVLAKVVHPDVAPEDSKKIAEGVFQKLLDIYEKAREAVVNNSYNKTFSMNNKQLPFIIQSRKSVYVCPSEPFKVGTFSILYRGENKKNGNEVLVKIASKPSANLALENEEHFLRKNENRYIPNVIDSFIISDANKRRYRSIVIPYLDGYFSLRDILNAYPKGLDPRDAAWICRRVISLAAQAEIFNVIHGAITPDHILVNPVTHDPLLIGWSYNIPTNGSRLRFIVSKWKEYYPPEVFAKEMLTPTVDIYMAGKVMTRLFERGGDVIPDNIIRVLSRCMDSSPERRPDAFKVLDELTRAIRTNWGKKYRRLDMS